MSREPKRLIVSEDNELGLGLASARRQLPSSLELARLAQRLSQAGVALPATSLVAESLPSPRLAHRPQRSGLFKVFTGLGGLAAVAGLGTWLATRTPAQSGAEPAAPPTHVGVPEHAAAARPRIMPAAPSSGAVTRRAPARSPNAVVTPVVPPVAAAQPEESAARPLASAAPAPLRERAVDSAPRAARSAAPRTSSRAVAADPGPVEYGAPTEAETPTTELELVKQARNALNSDPARAYALTERCRAEFPRAAFGQERDYIAITALARLGRETQARALASTFRTRYPRSVYTAQLQRLFGEE